MRLAVFLVLAACSAPRHAMTADQPFSDKATLVVELDRSPTGGAAFDFCPRPTSTELDWTNAAWLAFLSANAYSHMFYLAPVLADLGFTADGGIAWPSCAKDLRVMRGFEDRYHDALVAASHAKALASFVAPHAEKWGDCARRWFAEHYDGAGFPAPAFEKWLIQTPHSGEPVEFFSGGKIADGGRVFTEGSTQVTFMRHATLPLAIIAFRGTEPNRWNDVVTDLKAWKTPLGDGWGDVHTGFKHAFDSIAPVMRAKLDEYREDKLAIWVTGHSLGGGLATLMGAEILRRAEAGEDFDLRGVYTFGSPRVGNRAFRDKLMAAAGRHGTQLVRFRNGDDVVTAIPRVAEFEHVGQVAHLHENTFELTTRDPPYAGMGSLADHDIAGWVRPKKTVSGYYRRVLAVAKTHPRTCAAAPPVAAASPPVAPGTKLACAKLIDPARFTAALREPEMLTVRDDGAQAPDATATCALIKAGARPTPAEQQQLLQRQGRLGVLPGDAVCQVAAYCWTIEDAARFEAACAPRGGRFVDHTCVRTIANAAADLEVHTFLDDDSRCVLAVRGGPGNVDNAQVRACAEAARASIGPAQIAP